MQVSCSQRRLNFTSLDKSRRLTILPISVIYISIVSIWIIIVTVYPTIPDILIYSVAVYNLKFYLIPRSKREFLTIKHLMYPSG